jgi:hypothetical protein
MAEEAVSILSAASFADAQKVVTGWLGTERLKPGAQQFGEVASKFASWIKASLSPDQTLIGLALLGRLWSLASWRAVPGAVDWMRENARTLVDRLPRSTDDEVLFWGNADDRRFVSNALEAADTPVAQELGVLLFLTEPARKATKATAHHLECLRRQRLSWEVLLANAPTIWQRIARSLDDRSRSALFMFENTVSTLASSRWDDSEIGSPNLAALVEALSGAAQRASVDVRDAAAEQMLSLLETYRVATRRRKDLTPGYEPASALLAWFPGRRFPSVLSEAVNALLGELEQDIVGRLELGRREGKLRDLHRMLAGDALSSSRLKHAATQQKVNEQAAIWMQSGRWLDLAGGDATIAEAAAQDLDPLIAELMIDAGQLSGLRDARVSDAVRRIEALGRARHMSTFGETGQVVSFDPAKHNLQDNQLAADNLISVVRPGVVRRRSTGEAIIVKALVRNAEF